jgi:hypothetical protein
VNQPVDEPGRREGQRDELVGRGRHEQEVHAVAAETRGLGAHAVAGQGQVVDAEGALAGRELDALGGRALAPDEHRAGLEHQCPVLRVARARGQHDLAAHGAARGQRVRRLGLGAGGSTARVAAALERAFALRAVRPVGSGRRRRVHQRFARGIAPVQHQLDGSDQHGAHDQRADQPAAGQPTAPRRD